METESKCHIYSFPYEFKHFPNINSSFPGGVFHNVLYLTMFDDRPFEHKLFEIISQTFPFLERLHINNYRSQKDKQPSSTLITFPHLVFLNMKMAHVDYAEQFLLKKQYTSASFIRSLY
jgi:hypothetical protein